MKEGPLKVHIAGLFATAAHGAVNQVRKYTGDPYIVHPMAVCKIINEAVPFISYDTLAASLLHDVVEDTGVTVEMIDAAFGPAVAILVSQVTDVYTAEAYPDLNRKARKEREVERYKYVSYEAKTIKLADSLDNTSNIAEHDEKFLKTYGPEKRALIESLRGGASVLWRRLDRQLLDLGY